MLVSLGYTLYLGLSIILIFWIGKKLHRDGAVWLDYLFDGNLMGFRLNNLLLLGYYLVNTGYVIYTLTNWDYNISPLLEVARKIGAILLILSYLHYQNIFSIYFFHNNKILEKWKI